MVNVNMKLEMDSCLEDIFSYELEQLVDKYKNVNIEDKQSLEKLYSLIHKSNLPSYDMALSDAIKLSKEDTKLIKLYLWIRKNIQIDSLEDAKDILDKLEHDNYCILQGEHLIAYKDKDIDSAYREIFNELIADVDYVAEFFTKSKLAELWIEDTSIRDAIDEIISIEDPLEEYLNLEFDDKNTRGRTSCVIISKTPCKLNLARCFFTANPTITNPSLQGIQSGTAPDLCLLFSASKT